MIAINVSQLLKASPGASREFSFSDSLPEVASDVELTSPIEGKANLLRTSRGILAAVDYRTAVRQACGRCLRPADVDVQGSFSDEFMPRVDVVTGYPLEDQAESDELAIDEHHVLNLAEVIRQDLLTRLPFQPLCEPDCPGLCPNCGLELRNGGCECERTTDNSSPFAGLAELLRRDATNDASSG